MDKIIFRTDDGEDIELFVLETTTVGGISYILVSEDNEDTVMILKDISELEDEEASYVFVEDERELDAVLSIFQELMEEDIVK
ncbi:MAG: DUF1292 domain-containing protein [Lachnospiraceae bacterium]|jgi:hypothetical protein|nr:DUF1292 domain-containing protein [Lachnospiraceae bacterium]